MKQVLPPEQQVEFIQQLKSRFEKNAQRHSHLDWASVEVRLTAKPGKLCSLHQMETTGGEPDVIGFDPQTGEFIFCDCSAESPTGRRSLCYDRAALNLRKQHKPRNSAVDLAEAMGLGVQLLTEEQYKALQDLGKFDTKTSSWLKTPEEVRQMGGALFGDYRYGRVFTYHNGADSYYGVRGFRCILAV